MRLIKTHTSDKRTAKVYKNPEWEEHVVKFYKHSDDGRLKHQTRADYHTDDVGDAHDTAKHWIGQGSLKEDAINEVSDALKKRYAKKAVGSYAGLEYNAGRQLMKANNQDQVDWEAGRPEDYRKTHATANKISDKALSRKTYIKKALNSHPDKKKISRNLNDLQMKAGIKGELDQNGGEGIGDFGYSDEYPNRRSDWARKVQKRVGNIRKSINEIFDKRHIKEQEIEAKWAPSNPSSKKRSVISTAIHRAKGYINAPARKKAINDKLDDKIELKSHEAARWASGIGVRYKGDKSHTERPDMPPEEYYKEMDKQYTDRAVKAGKSFSNASRRKTKIMAMKEQVLANIMSGDYAEANQYTRKALAEKALVGINEARKVVASSLSEGEVVPFPGTNRRAAPAAPTTQRKVSSDPSDQQLHFHDFVRDNVRQHDGHSIKHTEAYENYCNHAEKNDVHPVDFASFSKKMRDKGFHSQHVAGSSRWIGIKVPEDLNEDETINEISKDLIKKYVDKSVDSLDKIQRQWSYDHEADEDAMRKHAGDDRSSRPIADYLNSDRGQSYKQREHKYTKVSSNRLGGLMNAAKRLKLNDDKVKSSIEKLEYKSDSAGRSGYHGHDSKITKANNAVTKQKTLVKKSFGLE